MIAASESPFHSYGPEPSGSCTLGRKYRWKIVDNLQEFIPFLRDVPLQNIVVLGSIILALMTCIFIIVFTIGYFESLDVTFLSPSDQVSDTKWCDDVPTTNTGTFYATQAGYWQNSPYFAFSNASYVVYIAGLSISVQEYSDLMYLVYDNLVAVGSIAVHQNLAINLLFWMAISFYVPEQQAQRFYLTGDPSIVFSRQHQGGYMGGINGTCNVTALTGYEPSTTTLSLTYPYRGFVDSSICAQIATPSLLGYLDGVDSNTVSVHIDVRTLITAVAVNLKILYPYDLVQVPSTVSNLTYDGVQYTVGRYYHPKFAGMAPVTCINVQTNITLCVLFVGDLVGIPIYHHAGASTTQPVPCNCTNRDALDIDNPYAQCNLFSFLSGFLFWDTPSADYAIGLAFKYAYNYAQLNEDSFNASFINSYWGQTSPDRDALTSPESLQRAFAFCRVDGLDCNVAVFSSFDSGNQINWAISSYYYEVFTGACQDTFSTSYDNWAKLVNYPFAPLNEAYLKCKNSPTVILLTQAGVAMGNVHLLAPATALTIVILFFFVYRPCAERSSNSSSGGEATSGSSSWLSSLYGRSSGTQQQQPQPSYVRVERDRASDILALALLLARDDKLDSFLSQQRSGTSQRESVLRQLATELQALRLPAEEGGEVLRSAQVSFSEAHGGQSRSGMTNAVNPMQSDFEGGEPQTTRSSLSVSSPVDREAPPSFT